MHTKIEPLEPTNYNFLLACLAGLFTAASIASLITAIVLKPTTMAIAITSFAVATSVSPIIPIVLGVIIGVGALLALGYLIYECTRLPESSRYELFADNSNLYTLMDPLGYLPNTFINYEPTSNRTTSPCEGNVHHHPSQMPHHDSNSHRPNFFESPKSVHHHPSQQGQTDSSVTHHPHHC